jgi:hypothetical protein
MTRSDNLPASGPTLALLRLALIGLALGLGAHVASAADGLRSAWTNDMLTVTAAGMPGTNVNTWYLEAFCRSGSRSRDWRQTTIPHKTELVKADADGKRLRLLTKVEPGVEMTHDIRAGRDEVNFDLAIKNTGKEFVDVQWFQPCMRVEGFTGLRQSNYIERCFIFTKNGLTMLDKTHRTEEALYRGGQVYVPGNIPLNDVNPRPISPDQPVNGLIG